MDELKIEDVVKKKKEQVVKKIEYVCVDCGTEAIYIKELNKTNKCVNCGKLNLMMKI